MDQNIELCTKTVACCAMHDDMYEAPLRLAEMSRNSDAPSSSCTEPV